MLLAIALAFSLVALSFTFHYRVLIWLSVSSQIKMDKQGRVLFIVFILFLAHIVEIGFYAVIYNLSVTTLDLGFFNGASIGEPMNYLYYSGVIFTTLGLGDIQPVGHIRFITAIEALNGFGGNQVLRFPIRVSSNARRLPHERTRPQSPASSV